MVRSEKTSDVVLSGKFNVGTGLFYIIAIVGGDKALVLERCGGLTREL